MNIKGNIARTAFLAALLATACTAAVAAENVYRWKDSSGNTVHSDRPPPEGIEYEKISTSASFTHKVADEAPADAAPDEPEAAGSSSDNKESSTAIKPSSAKDPQYCSAAQQNLATLETGARIRIMDESGEYRYLTEEQKEIERGKARAIIEAHCE